MMGQAERPHLTTLPNLALLCLVLLYLYIRVQCRELVYKL